MIRGGRFGLALMAAFALAASAFGAENVWFDTGIPDYVDWPDSGSKILDGVGVWTGTECALLVGEPGARSLEVDTPASYGLEFAAEFPKSFSDELVVLQTRVAMESLCPEAELELPDVGTKCALTAADETEAGVDAFYGLARDPEGMTNVWTRLEGDVVPSTGTLFEVRFELKKDGGRRLVRYTVDGHALTSGGVEWLETAYAASVSERVSSVLYSGIGDVNELTGLTEGAAAETALTIPEFEHLSVASVKANGVKITAEDGVYKVPEGSVVVVTFEAESGYVLTAASMKFVAAGSEMTLPDEGRPGAVYAAGLLTINEVMASNGDVIRTRNGGKGLDWVEVYNSSDTAIDLTGYYLHDKPDDKKSKWTLIEGSCVVPAKGYKVVWCDKSYDAFTSDEAYARLGLSGNGEPLFLATPTGEVLQRIDFPGQIKGISYGVGKLERPLLSMYDAAEYRVGGGEWKPVRGPLGMSSVANKMKVTSYKAKNGEYYLNNIQDAKDLIADSSRWDRNPVTASVDGSIAYAGDVSKSYTFGPYAPMPGGCGNVALVFEGVVNVPRSGLWTFSVGSDDGFELTLSNNETSYTMGFENLRGYTPSLSAFSMEAGAYNLKLVYFDQGGDAIVDLSVAEGDKSGGFSLADFKLVGATDCPVELGGELAGFLSKDLTEELRGKSDTFDWRANFVLEDLPAPDDVVRLRLRYADGFDARVNGHAVAAVAADAPRSVFDTLTYVTYEIDPSFLRQGTNELTITAANDAQDDGEMFLSAQVMILRGQEEFAYFTEPTPGAANSSDGRGAMTPAVVFSEPHGYKTETFQLELSCPDLPRAPIYYTTDGTSPTAASTLYTGPIEISSTTCIRAAVPQDNTVLQVDTAATYIFLDDVLMNQLPTVTPAGFPESYSVNNHAMRYGMNRKLVESADPEVQRRLHEGFTNSIATLSVVIDPKGLFDSASGIYVNPSGDGRSWERPMMLEQIDPVHGEVNEFAVPAGIRIRGAASRGNNYAKHSFRLFFRGEYGMSSLAFPLFGEEGADSFDKVDLRCSQNYSVANENNRSDTFIHECFSRDSQGAMGEPYARSRYYNLFINGQYWGLYQTEERGDEDFAETYAGGSADDYDVIKTSQPGYVTGATAGTDAAWKALWELIVNTPDGEKNYFRAMGLNDDGTRNPDYPVYLDPTNLIVYVLNFHYVCDADAPVSLSGFPNNLFAIRNRKDGAGKRDGFFYLRHDAEHSMGVRWESDYRTDMTTFGTEYDDGTESQVHGPRLTEYTQRFNPAELFWRLTKNPAFRETVADLYHKFFIKEGGAMTVPVATERFRKRMAEIDSAIVCEHARWSQEPENPCSYSDWMRSCNDRLGFISLREPEMRRHYQARGWYPTTEAAVAVDADGVALADGAALAPNAGVFLASVTPGTVYYTLDGSDPRGADGRPSASALVYSGGAPVPVEITVFPRGSEWSYYQAGGRPDGDWTASGYDDGGWSKGAGRLGFAGSGTFATTLRRYVNGSSGEQITTYYFRRKFRLPATGTLPTELKFSLDCDDGYVLYVNGVEVKRDQVNSTEYSAFSTATNMGEKNETVEIPAGVLKAGENTIAVEVHQCNAGSSDVWWDLGLSYFTSDPSASGIVMPVEGLELSTRVLGTDGVWSVRDTVKLVSDLPEADPADALRIAAVMSSAPGGDAGDFVTLTNLTGSAVSLVDVKLVAWNAKKKSEADPSLVKNLTRYGRILPYGALTLDAEAFGSNDRLTDSDVGLKLYFIDGGVTNLVQEAYVSADWFGGVCDEGGGYFIARTFGKVATTVDDWMPSIEPPVVYPPVVEEMMRTNASVKTWIESLCNDAAKESAVMGYTGDAATLMKCYLVDVTPEAEPEIKIGIPIISVGADGSVKVGGSLTVHEVELEKSVNGDIRLYHATTLEALPTSKSYLDFGHVFPIVDRPVEGLPDAPSRFFRLKVE